MTSSTDRFYTEEEDRGYRRGFDQGVAALAYALGIPNGPLQQSAFKARVNDFRHGRLRDAKTLWTATADERTELRRLIP